MGSLGMAIGKHPGMGMSTGIWWDRELRTGMDEKWRPTAAHRSMQHVRHAEVCAPGVWRIQ